MQEIAKRLQAPSRLPPAVEISHHKCRAPRFQICSLHQDLNLAAAIGCQYSEMGRDDPDFSPAMRKIDKQTSAGLQTGQFNGSSVQNIYFRINQKNVAMPSKAILVMLQSYSVHGCHMPNLFGLENGLALLESIVGLLQGNDLNIQIGD